LVWLSVGIAIVQSQSEVLPKKWDSISREVVGDQCRIVEIDFVTDVIVYGLETEVIEDLNFDLWSKAEKGLGEGIYYAESGSRI